MEFSTFFYGFPNVHHYCAKVTIQLEYLTQGFPEQKVIRNMCDWVTIVVQCNNAAQCLAVTEYCGCYWQLILLLFAFLLRQIDWTPDCQRGKTIHNKYTLSKNWIQTFYWKWNNSNSRLTCVESEALKHTIKMSRLTCRKYLKLAYD